MSERVWQCARWLDMNAKHMRQTCIFTRLERFLSLESTELEALHHLDAAVYARLSRLTHIPVNQTLESHDCDTHLRGRWKVNSSFQAGPLTIGLADLSQCCCELGKQMFPHSYRWITDNLLPLKLTNCGRWSKSDRTRLMIEGERIITDPSSLWNTSWKTRASSICLISSDLSPHRSTINGKGEPSLNWWILVNHWTISVCHWYTH